MDWETFWLNQECSSDMSHLLHFTHSHIVIQSHSRVRLFATPWTAAHQVSLPLTISWSLPQFMAIASVMPSIHLVPWCPLLLLPSVFPSIRNFSSELAVHISWPKYWIFSFSISPSNEYSELIPFKIDRFDLFAVQGTLRSLLQHHSLKASVLWRSTFPALNLPSSHNHTWPLDRLRPGLCGPLSAE